MNVFFASDHAGFVLKEALVQYAQSQTAIMVQDLGPDNANSVDYPDFAHKLVAALQEPQETLGVLICGTGIGMSMVANRHSHIRAALCYNEYAARMARAHNNANVLCMGARIVANGLAEAIFDAFVATRFEGGRHAQRVAKFDLVKT